MEKAPGPLNNQDIEKLTEHVQGMRESQKAILDAEAELKILAAQHKATGEETPAGAWEEQTAAMRKAQMMETPPEAWETFGQEALEAKKNAEKYGWTVGGTPVQTSELKSAPIVSPPPVSEKPAEKEKPVDPKPVEQPKTEQKKPETFESSLKSLDDKVKDAGREPERMERLRLAAQASAAERAQTVDKTIKEKLPANLLGTIDRWAKAYKALPMWKKIAIGVGLGTTVAGAAVVGGPTSYLTLALWTGARFPGFLSGYALTDALQKRNAVIEGDWRKIKSTAGGVAWAVAMGAVGQWAGSYIHEWWSGTGAPATPVAPKITSTLTPTSPSGDYPPYGGLEDSQTPSVEGFGEKPFLPHVGTTPGTALHTPAAPMHAGIFSERITVTAADSKKGLWGILERKLLENGMLTKNTPVMQRNIILDSLEKKLNGLGSDKLQALGFRPDQHGRVFIDVIRPGEKLDLSILNTDATALPAQPTVPMPPVRPSVPGVPLYPDVPEIRGLPPTHLNHPLVVANPLAIPQGTGTLSAHASVQTPDQPVTPNVVSRVINMTQPNLETIKTTLDMPALGVVTTMEHFASNWHMVTDKTGITMQDYTWVNRQLLEARDTFHINLLNKSVRQVLDELSKQHVVASN